jgi:hypothetical protein
MAERRGEMREGLTMVVAEAWGDQQSEREREREAELRREAGTLERGSASGRLPALVAPEP